MRCAKRGEQARHNVRAAKGPRHRNWCGAAALLLCGGLLAPHAHAEAGAATSDRAARDEAVRAIPWRQLTPQNRRSAQLVVSGASIYRRLPERIIDCDPEVFTFLLQHPEVVIDIWRLMGISHVTLQKLPGGAYRGTDGAGTTGTVRYLYADWGPQAQILAVVFADGTYDGPPLVAPVKAQSLFVLRSAATRETNGRHYITVRVDSFVRIEQVAVELVAKTLQPWIAKTADQNFIETLTFVSNFSRTAEKNPHGIERLAARLPTLDEPTRQELVALSFRTAERYAAAQGHRAVVQDRDVTVLRAQPQFRRGAAARGPACRGRG
jgi:hypothetical protein